MYEEARENALREQELSLRNQGLFSVNELKPLPNKFDAIDLTGNFLSRLLDIPLLSGPLTRLKTLILANNQIDIVSSDISAHFPNLISLSLANNQISDWKSLQFISRLPKLKQLIIKGNPITANENYEQKLREIQPNLKYVDWAVVKPVGEMKKISKENQQKVDELMKKLEEATSVAEVEKIEMELAELS